MVSGLLVGAVLGCPLVLVIGVRVMSVLDGCRRELTPFVWTP